VAVKIHHILLAPAVLAVAATAQIADQQPLMAQPIPAAVVVVGVEPVAHQRHSARAALAAQALLLFDTQTQHNAVVAAPLRHTHLGQQHIGFILSTVMEPLQHKDFTSGAFCKT
jgi:hypothetical protein